MTGLVLHCFIASNSERDNADVGTRLCMCVYMWAYAYVSSWPLDTRYVPYRFPPLLSSTGWLIPESCISQCLLSAGFLLGLTNGTHQWNCGQRMEEVRWFFHFSLHPGPSFQVAVSIPLLWFLLSRCSAFPTPWFLPPGSGKPPLIPLVWGGSSFLMLPVSGLLTWSPCDYSSIPSSL